MDEELQAALECIDEAASTIFARDAATRSVGIGLVQGRLAIVVLRNVASAATDSFPAISSINGLPVSYQACQHDPMPLRRLPAGLPVPERARHRPLVCGLAIQNLDHDRRQDPVEESEPICGSLGCFIRFPDGTVGLLSNNHIIAGENHAVVGDRIVQPCMDCDENSETIARLTHHVPLVMSGRHTTFHQNGRAPNVVDAATAALEPGQSSKQHYLAARTCAPPGAVGNATLGLRVHKVGRGNGESFGVVRQVGVVVGPLHYMRGQCWFRRAIVIESDDGPAFSQGGDSGAVIVDDHANAVGLLYGGLPGGGDIPHQTYACPMGVVLAEIGCQLA